MAITLSPKDLSDGAHNLDVLRNIVSRSQHARVRLGGKTSAVDLQTANLLLVVYEALSPDNKVNFVGLLGHSAGSFARLVTLAWCSTKVAA